MASRHAVVIDTNVVVAGILTADPGAPPALVLDGMLEGRFPFAASLVLIKEYRDVLLRPRIARRHALGAGELDALLTEVVTNAIVLEPPPSAVAAPDPGDQHLWDLLAALAGVALVTGDRRLLRDPGPHRLLSPREFVETYR